MALPQYATVYETAVDRCRRGRLVVVLGCRTSTGQPRTYMVAMPVTPAARRYTLHGDCAVRAKFAVGAAIQASRGAHGRGLTHP
jgi:hypothetical protein